MTEETTLAAPAPALAPAEVGSSAEPLIKVHELRKTYRSGWTSRRRVEALRGVSLEVLPGEVFGLLGPNGAGKTTLIKVLLGIVRSSGGRASVLGQPAGSVASRRRIGYLPENLRIERHHTARSALAFYGRLSDLSGAALQRRIDSLLELVGLEGRDREPVSRFSKGMGQRLGLAQALLNDPELLILDEPTDGLDPVGRADVRKLLRRLGDEGKSVLMNSHILQEVELVCDRVAIMTHGTLRSLGRIDELTPATPRGTATARSSLHIQVASEQTRLALDALSSPNSLSSQTPATALQSLPAFRPVLGQPTRHGTVPITLEVEDQAATDHCVDRLRDADVSILRLEVRRPSLEDVFLEIVRSDPEAPPEAEIAAEAGLTAEFDPADAGNGN
ncbi:ABC transporter ATP-binding protein [Candidatus Laterigemmans baculatus]|uniref:ABC transporter ATP-binding protein n=1 Tax=Candidatus Laterigemmans baculatus TaxID=2770505 RepID=UPI001F179DC2|nr:ABC transporter ATP-binding protein [Candidatus Laterigemmans baculatus]